MEAAVLKGHTGGVRKVVFLPHVGGGSGGECVGTVGTRTALNVLSCALDGTLRVWKWRGKPTAVSTVLEGHGKAVTSFCILGMHSRPNGLTEAVHADEQATFAGCSRVLTASTDRTARVFDLHSGRCATVLERHPGDVAAVAVCALGVGGATATAAELAAAAVVATGSFNFLALWDVRCPQRPVAQLHRAAGSVLAGVRIASTSNVRLSCTALWPQACHRRRLPVHLPLCLRALLHPQAPSHAPIAGPTRGFPFPTCGTWLGYGGRGAGGAAWTRVAQAAARLQLGSM